MSRSVVSSQDSIQPEHAQSSSEPEIGTVTKTGVVIGRNKVVVDPDEVYKLATYHCSIKDISNFFGVPRDTIQYNFGDLIIKGYETTKQSLRMKQIEVAMSGNPTMLIWLGKQMLGQADTPESNNDEDGNGEISVTVKRPQKPDHIQIDIKTNSEEDK